MGDAGTTKLGEQIGDLSRPRIVIQHGFDPSHFHFPRSDMATDQALSDYADTK